MALGAETGGEPPHRSPAPRTSEGQRHALEMHRSFGVTMSPVLFGIRVQSVIDPKALQAALIAVGRQHAALRQCFPFGDPYASACLEPDEYDLPLRVADDPPDLAAAEQAMADYLRAPFDPGRPPLARAALIQRPPESRLAISIDHAIFDRDSVGPFLRALSRAYVDGAAGSGDASRFFGEEESDWLEGDAGARALEHWEPRWQETVPTLSNPLASGDGSPPARAYSRHRMSVSAEEIASASRRYRSSAPWLFCLEVVAVMHALRTVGGTDHPSVFVHTSRRYTPRSASYIGSFVNTVLIPVDLSEARHFADTARATRDEVVSALKHSMMPYQFLRRRFAPRQAPDLAGMPAIVINVMRESDPAAFAGLPTEYYLPRSAEMPLARGHHHAEFFIIDILEKQDGGTDVICSFREPPCESDTVHRFTEVVREVLSGTVEELA